MNFLYSYINKKNILGIIVLVVLLVILFIYLISLFFTSKKAEIFFVSTHPYLTEIYNNYDLENGQLIENYAKDSSNIYEMKNHIYYVMTFDESDVPLKLVGESNVKVIDFKENFINNIPTMDFSGDSYSEGSIVNDEEIQDYLYSIDNYQKSIILMRETLLGIDEVNKEGVQASYFAIDSILDNYLNLLNDNFDILDKKVIFLDNNYKGIIQDIGLTSESYFIVSEINFSSLLKYIRKNNIQYLIYSNKKYNADLVALDGIEVSYFENVDNKGRYLDNIERIILNLIEITN